MELVIGGLPEESVAELLTCFRGEDGEWEEWETAVAADDAPFTLDSSWRGVPWIAAVSPPYLASRVVPVPASGPIRLELEPGGLLMVAPEEIAVEEFGTLRLRRADGRVIPMTGGRGATYAWSAREMDVEAGELLGPFPEGTMGLRGPPGWAAPPGRSRRGEGGARQHPADLPVGTESASLADSVAVRRAVPADQDLPPSKLGGYGFGAGTSRTARPTSAARRSPRSPAGPRRGCSAGGSRG